VFPTTDMASWGRRGTEGGPWASFFRRYERPLADYARRRLGVDPGLAEELAARFVARELGRDRAGEPPIFRLYDPQRGRFRSLLATTFFRFARDELAKEGRRSGPSLEEALAADPAADDAFCGLVARELFEVVRGRLRADAAGPEEVAVLDLKWPAGPSGAPLPNAEVERRLGLSRARVRTLTDRIAAGFVRHLRRIATQAGLSPAELEPFLGDTCHALDRAGRAGSA